MLTLLVLNHSYNMIWLFKYLGGGSLGHSSDPETITNEELNKQNGMKYKIMWQLSQQNLILNSSDRLLSDCQLYYLKIEDRLEYSMIK